MIQFNLLPDIKLEYIKAQRNKKLVMMTATLITAFSVFIFIVMVLQVYVVQKHQNSTLDSSIKKSSDTLNNSPDIDKVLTVQNQLNTLVTLQTGEGSKEDTSRVFNYLSQLTPVQVKIGNLAMDYSTDDVTFSGTADKLETVNTFVDTMKFTTYKTSDSNDTQKAFKSVVLTTFNRDDKSATYTIDVVFDPALFDSSVTPTLIVPKQYTTRSITEEPDIGLFDGKTGPVLTNQIPGGTSSAGN